MNTITLRADPFLLLLVIAACSCDSRSTPVPQPEQNRTRTVASVSETATASELPTVSAPASAAAPTSAPTSASATATSTDSSPQAEPERLAAGLGLGKALALHNGYLYWTTSAKSGLSSSDARIVRMPKDGGTPRDVASSLDTVTSLAFDEDSVFWAMCGTTDYVQRCRLTRTSQKGGKRTLVYDAGPSMVTHAVWSGDSLVWAEAGENRIHRINTTQTKPTILTNADEVTDMVVSGGSIIWSEGRSLEPTGAVKRVSADGVLTNVARHRRYPRYLAADGGYLYWVETDVFDSPAATQRIVVVALEGGEPRPIVENLPRVEGIAAAASRVVVIAGDTVSWVSVVPAVPAVPTISTASTASTAPTASTASTIQATAAESRVLATGQKSPGMPVADETHAYWIADDKVWRMAFTR